MQRAPGGGGHALRLRPRIVPLAARPLPTLTPLPLAEPGDAITSHAPSKGPTVPPRATKALSEASGAEVALGSCSEAAATVTSGLSGASSGPSGPALSSARCLEAVEPVTPAAAAPRVPFLRPLLTRGTAGASSVPASMISCDHDSQDLTSSRRY